MIAEAIGKIIEISKPTIQKVDHTFFSDRTMVPVAEEKHRLREIKVSGLQGLAEMVRHEASNLCWEKRPLFIEIVDPKNVRVFSALDEDLDRDIWYSTEADVPGFKNGYRSYEEFVIELRSRFVENEGSRYLLELLSKMDINERSTSEDNGITQQVTVRQGIALKDTETVRPIVPLRPYRTFFEVDQPESEFLVRVDKDGMIGLFEADGGMWRQQAKQNIFTWMDSNFCKETAEGWIRILC